MENQAKQYWTVLFKDKTTGNKAMRLTPDGGLTRLKIYAWMIPSLETAEAVAGDIRHNHPDAQVMVSRF